MDAMSDTQDDSEFELNDDLASKMRAGMQVQMTMLGTPSRVGIRGMVYALAIALSEADVSTEEVIDALRTDYARVQKDKLT